MIAALAIAATVAQTAAAGEISERLARPPSFEIQSSKAAVDLEFCIADALSKIGPPASFRDGADRTVLIVDAMGKIVATVELNGHAAGTVIVARIMGRGWDDRMRERMTRCA